MPPPPFKGKSLEFYNLYTRNHNKKAKFDFRLYKFLRSEVMALALPRNTCLL